MTADNIIFLTSFLKSIPQPLPGKPFFLLKKSYSFGNIIFIKVYYPSPGLNEKLSATVGEKEPG